jgi:hypothetical protein
LARQHSGNVEQIDGISQHVDSVSRQRIELAIEFTRCHHQPRRQGVIATQWDQALHSLKAFVEK